MLTYEIATRFVKELQTMNFNGTKRFDFYSNQQATASGLSLAIY